MRLIIPYVLIFFILSFSGCSPRSESTKKKADVKLKISGTLSPFDLITVDLDTLRLRVGKYSSLYDNVKYVPLETNTDNLIGDIEDIQLFRDTLYILDSRSARSVYVFDLDGRFIRRIGRAGRGPGEWESPVSFTIDKSLHYLCVLDGSLHKIFLYSTSGTFIKTIDLKDMETRSHYLKSGFGKFYLDARIVSPDKNKPKYLLRELGHDGVETKRWFPIPAYNKGFDRGKSQNIFYFSRSNCIPKGANDLKFTDIFMDTIFSITEQGVRPSIVIKSKDLLTQDKLEEIAENRKAGEYSSVLIKENLVWNIKNYVENGNNILFQYSKGNRVNVISIIKKPMMINHYLYFIDDLTFPEEGGQLSQPVLMSGDGNLIIGLVPKLSTLQDALRTNKSTLPYQEREALLKIPATNNPVLVVLRTK